MTLIRKSFYSGIQNKTYDYHVLKASDTIEEAFVLYVQDGNDYLELGGVESTVQKLMHLNPELTEKLIIVFIHPGDSLERWHSYHRKGESFAIFTRFMVEEFIPSIEQELTVQNIYIVKRGLLGDSLGGNIILNIALQSPNIWTHLLLQSAAVSKEDIKSLSRLEKLDWSIYQTVGTFEDEFVSPITKTKLYILSRNKELYQVFLDKMARIHYSEQAEEHLWTFWNKDLPNALNFFIKTP
ncbi:hypothetical protein AF332_19145 [Sporosarcina globispora]|uniref:Esterase n=1 Tax=Sporosarcina globispora TaxID=1459 RepID=A0A0M0GGY6_SPOGL|nr:alpha/beta hydrolase-fold protein [Sporosarcina globispora]KON88711.1 hypothetical protein AF332_19145 [Sporosarcina globispora]